MKLNQQEKCAHKKNLGESCSQCNEAWNDMTSPHQEGWEERFVRSFCDDHGTDDKYKYFDGATIPRDIIAFIRQELTTLHKADCERFRGMIGKDEKKMPAPIRDLPAITENNGKDVRNEFRAELRTALSKMEEEK